MSEQITIPFPTKEKFQELARSMIQGASFARRDDRLSIPYRPRLNRITGSMVSSILLQQIEFYWTVNDAEPFYKFASPCNHELYKEGDSWYEELDIKRAEFENARNKIGTKITRGVSKKTARNYRDENGRLQKPDHLVLYWTDSNMVTWYELNADLMNAYTLMTYHNATEDEVLSYLDHMYGLVEYEIFKVKNGGEMPDIKLDNVKLSNAKAGVVSDGDVNDVKNEESSPIELQAELQTGLLNSVSPSDSLPDNAFFQHLLIPESHRESLLESKDSNINFFSNQPNQEVNQTVKSNAMNYRKPQEINRTPQVENTTPNKGIPFNATKNVFESMKNFTNTYNNMPNPSEKPPSKTSNKAKTVKNKPAPEIDEIEMAVTDTPKKSRKKRTSPTGNADYQEWLVAVLDLFNLANFFTGYNYDDPTVGAYSKTAKSMRLMAMEFNEHNPDKTPVDASIVKEFYAWMIKKGWKDVGQKALVERFPEYMKTMLDKPVNEPYRVAQLKKWVAAEEKRYKKPVSDEERVKLQELLDIEIITNYHQLIDQIPLAEYERLSRGLADGSIYNPFN